MTTQKFLKEAMRRNFGPINGMKDILVSLKEQDYRLGLASDNAKEWVEHMGDQIPLDIFEAVLFSYECGIAKRDQNPEFYRQALEKLGSDGKKTLYIDDKPGNVEIATSPEVGIAYGHVFANAPSFRRALKKDYQITV